MEFRPMRRHRQELSPEACREVLERATSGVLALAGDDDYPYAVPISYVYDGEKLYFHCAKSGHKLDAVKRNPKASFCVIGQDRVIPDEYTTAYRSVIAFGRIRILTEDREIRSAAERLGLRYAPHHTKERRDQEINKEWSRLCMLEMTVEHLTGKEGRSLLKEQE